MAEYNDVIKQFKRMCRYYNDNKYDCPSYCKGSGCSISLCRKIAFERPAEFEEYVMAWVTEHPEPVYPTWEEWLVTNGIMEPDNVRLNGDYRFCYNGIPVYNIPSPKMFDPIPTDIAQKLGIEPKEAR